MTIVFHDYGLDQIIGDLRSRLNSGHTLRLFQNNFTPDTNSVIGDFSEATFTGYATASLTGVFSSDAEVADGEWEAPSPTFTFSCTGGSSQVVYGWYIYDSTNVVASCKFAAPYTMAPGGADLQFVLNLDVWAASTIGH